MGTGGYLISFIGALAGACYNYECANRLLTEEIIPLTLQVQYMEEKELKVKFPNYAQLPQDKLREKAVKSIEDKLTVDFNKNWGFFRHTAPGFVLGAAVTYFIVSLISEFNNRFDPNSIEQPRDYNSSSDD